MTMVIMVYKNVIQWNSFVCIFLKEGEVVGKT